ncbi:hypothetical protein N2152v2_008885 [Parachlorella kessleri]
MFKYIPLEVTLESTSGHDALDTTYVSALLPTHAGDEFVSQLSLPEFLLQEPPFTSLTLQPLPSQPQQPSEAPASPLPAPTTCCQSLQATETSLPQSSVAVPAVIPARQGSPQVALAAAELGSPSSQLTTLSPKGGAQALSREAGGDQAQAAGKSDSRPAQGTPLLRRVGEGSKQDVPAAAAARTPAAVADAKSPHSGKPPSRLPASPFDVAAAAAAKPQEPPRPPNSQLFALLLRYWELTRGEMVGQQASPRDQQVLGAQEQQQCPKGQAQLRAQESRVQRQWQDICRQLGAEASAGVSIAVLPPTASLKRSISAQQGAAPPKASLKRSISAQQGAAGAPGSRLVASLEVSGQDSAGHWTPAPQPGHAEPKAKRVKLGAKDASLEISCEQKSEQRKWKTYVKQVEEQNRLLRQQVANLQDALRLWAANGRSPPTGLMQQLLLPTP